MGSAGEEVLRFGFHRMGAESWGKVGGAPNMDAPPSPLLTCGTSLGSRLSWPAAVILM